MKATKAVKIKKKEVKLSLFVDDRIICEENPKGIYPASQKIY